MLSLNMIDIRSGMAWTFAVQSLAWTKMQNEIRISISSTQYEHVVYQMTTNCSSLNMSTFNSCNENYTSVG